jgi:hypothetical protein
MMILLQVILCVSIGIAAERHPDVVVRQLYAQIVARHPLGIPKGADRTAIWPFLSKHLKQRLEAARACEADYIRQHSVDHGKPAFGWLESGLFSGDNEEALPEKAVIERTEQRNDGSFQVYVRLTYKESSKAHHRPPDPAGTFSWNVAVNVILEDRRFVIDDVLLFKDDSPNVRSRLSDAFVGCEGSRWIGLKSSN